MVHEQTCSLRDQMGWEVDPRTRPFATSRYIHPLFLAVNTKNAPAAYQTTPAKGFRPDDHSLLVETLAAAGNVAMGEL
jgi:hypothetical protein